MPAQQTGSYVEFGPIVAGSILACAITVILFQFGSTLGMSIDRVSYYEGHDFLWRVIVIGLWVFWVQLISALCGGYISGRLRQPAATATPHESEVRDGLHGLLVWALSTLLMAVAAGVAAFVGVMAAAHGVEPAHEPQVSAAMARKSGMILGFSVAAGSIISGIGAWIMATIGGDHRDTSKDLSKLFSFRRR